MLTIEEMVEGALPSVVRVESAGGIGTGFIYRVEGEVGYVLTNEHVVGAAKSVTIFVDDTGHAGVVLGADESQDIAVISICCGDFESLLFSDVEISPGAAVVAIGHALGLEGDPTVTRGIVSAARWDRDLAVDLIQTDASINSGNSGGPLLGSDGRVVGMNTWKYTGDAEGLAFAIDQNVLRMRAPALASSDELHFEGRRFLRVAGPVDGRVGFLPSYAFARNFIAEAVPGENWVGLGWHQSLLDGLQPSDETLWADWDGCKLMNDEWEPLDMSDGVPIRVGDHLRAVVLNAEWRLFVNGELACQFPWNFGRAGWIQLVGYSGSDSQAFTDFSVWVD